MTVLIVFSDLDGTILDAETYSPAAARPGLSLLKGNGCPLVPASSKTYDEMRGVMDELEIDGPFIFENGGGIAWPAEGNYRIQEMGAPLDELAEAVDMVEDAIRRSIIQVRHLGIDRVVSITGFTPLRAELVLRRMFSLPFILDADPLSAVEITEANMRLEKWGFRITRGERFHYLSSVGVSKGEAMDEVVRICREEGRMGNFRTAAIGDSINDLAMLERADIPYVVRRVDGSAIKIERHDVRVTAGIGPAGFTEAVMDILKNG